MAKSDYLPDVQIHAVKSLYPNWEYKRSSKSVVFWGDLIVSDSLPIYRVKIEYRGNRRPNVKIKRPTIVKNAPHRFNDGSLCLYREDLYDWNAHKLLTTEIIPWTAAWIYFYEYWLQTGAWVGPEAPHFNNTSNKLLKNEKSFSR